VFSKHKSERMPLQKPYNHTIDFMEGTNIDKKIKEKKKKRKEKKNNNQKLNGKKMKRNIK